jgi:hypothetical protein
MNAALELTSGHLPQRRPCADDLCSRKTFPKEKHPDRGMMPRVKKTTNQGAVDMAVNWFGCPAAVVQVGAAGASHLTDDRATSPVSGD